MVSRVVYMGTPDFACPALDSLASDVRVEVALVVTQPDRPAGRGRQVQAPPVKRAAERLGLPVYQTASLRSAAQRQPIVNAQPDLIVVAAFGLILSKSILELPVHGCVNLHASLLPKYRGASPVSAAILGGDLETGVTLMQMERGLDSGPVLAHSSIDINPEDTTESLTDRLASVAGELLLSNLGDVTAGGLKSVPQRGGSSMTRPLVKADGWIDWSLTASEIERHVRAMWAWPRAWTTMRDGTPFQLHCARVAESNELAPAGTVVRDGRRLRIRCGEGWLEVETGQFAGGNPLGGAQLASNQAFVNQPILGRSERPMVPGPMVEPVD